MNGFAKGDYLSIETAMRAPRTSEILEALVGFDQQHVRERVLGKGANGAVAAHQLEGTFHSAVDSAGDLWPGTSSRRHLSGGNVEFRMAPE